MRIRMSRVHATPDPANAVTSPLIFKPHGRRGSRLVYHSDGLFSKRIFGNVYRCDCGKVTGEGFCEECGTRVVNLDHLPEFYVDMMCAVPALLVDWDDAHRHADGKWDRSIKCTVQDLQAIGEYRSFLWMDDRGERIVVNASDGEFDPQQWVYGQVMTGPDALAELGVRPEWIRESTTSMLLVPHPMYRPMVLVSGGSPLITPVNERYVRAVQGACSIRNAMQAVERMGIHGNLGELYLMAAKRAMAALYQEVNTSILQQVQEDKYSVIKSEIIGHPVSGAVRATLINRYDVNEDVILVGDALIPTLYPNLYQQCEGDMEAINTRLVEGDALLLLNRPPTINHYSVMALRPRVASRYPLGHLDGTCGALWDQPVKGNIPPVPEEAIQQCDLGDVELLGNTGADGVDTLGIRCVGCNPLMMNVMNADVDGDVLLEVALYGKDALKEAATMLPSKSWLNYANGKIRNAILEDLIFADLVQREGKIQPGDALERGLARYAHLSRKQYQQVNADLGELSWSCGGVPTVADIADALQGAISTPMQNVLNFFNNHGEFTSMVQHVGHLYSDEESERYIQSVMSSNNTDISESGAFYKLLMASADNLVLSQWDCGSPSYLEIPLSELSPALWRYRVLFSWVEECNCYITDPDLQTFLARKELEGVDTIHVRTPIRCGCLPDNGGKMLPGHRVGICERCAGLVPKGAHQIGAIMALMVTECSTQSALDSMNKGVHQNINKALSVAGPEGADWKGIQQWVDEVVGRMQGDAVFARYYEIAMLSRVRWDGNLPFVTTFKSAMKFSGNTMGAWIFEPKTARLQALVNAGEVDDGSLKLQIAMNQWEVPYRAAGGAENGSVN